MPNEAHAIIPGRRRRWVIPVLVASIVTAYVVLPGIAGAGSGTGGGVPDDPQLATEAVQLDQTIIEMFNDRRWDELTGVYAEDAVLLSPNHEPIQGRAGIIDYLRHLRDSVGEVQRTDTIRAAASGRLASLVSAYTAYSGSVRATGHGLFKREPDGSLRFAVDQFGLRDPFR